MSEQQNQNIIDQLNLLAKSASLAAVSVIAFIDYMKMIRSSNWYSQQYNKNYMKLRYHVHVPQFKEKRVIKKLRTRKDLVAINQSARNRREMNKIILNLKLKSEYRIPGRNPNSVHFKNGSSFEIRSK